MASMWARLFTTSEGRILVMGLVMVLSSIVGLAFSWLKLPEKSQVLLAMTATNIIFGRAAGMSFGYAGGLSRCMVMPVANILVFSSILYSS
jgi:hypothetical protein